MNFFGKLNYCEGQGLLMRQIIFRSEGQLTKETDTPAPWEREDEDRSNMLEQQQVGPRERKRPATSLQNSVPPDQEDILSEKPPFGSTTPRLPQCGFLYPFMFPFPIPLLYVK